MTNHMKQIHAQYLLFRVLLVQIILASCYSVPKSEANVILQHVQFSINSELLFQFIWSTRLFMTYLHSQAFM